MKVTIGDLYDELGKRIKENGDLYRDMVIINSRCHSLAGSCNNIMKPEEYLHYFDIIAVSSDGAYITAIDFGNKKEASDVT